MSIPPTANFGVQGQGYDPLLGNNVRRAVSELNGRSNIAAAGDAHMGLGGQETRGRHKQHNDKKQIGPSTFPRNRLARIINMHL